jgi:putative ABC transport system permease protein
MKMLFKIAWRNVIRNKRRTIITVIAIVFAAYLSVIMRGMQKGVYSVSITNAVEMMSGYMQIQEEEFNETPSLRNSFKMDLALFSYLKNNEKIKGVSPRINSNCLIGSDNTSLGAMLIALNPELDKNVTKLNEKVEKGKFLNNDNIYEIVVGEKLMKNLNSSVGDTVVILASSYEGYMGNLKFVIGGSFKTGSPELDKSTLFMNIKAADELLSMHNKITSVAIGLNSLEDLIVIKDEISNHIKDSNLTVLDWGELMPDLKQSIEFDDASGIVYLMFLILIVGFGIMNTINMSVTERYKEFGVMLALGAKHGFIAMTLFLEIVIITLISLTVGLAAGYFTNMYYIKNPYEFTGELKEMYQQFGFDAHLTSSVSPEIFISTSLTVLIVALLVCFISTFKIYKLEALKGIRHI